MRGEVEGGVRSWEAEAEEKQEESEERMGHV